MIRKRTVIKPNLGQAATKVACPPSLAPVSAPIQPIIIEEPQQEQPSISSNREDQDDHAGKIDDYELSKRVNDAISHLTGQKFEPIKSASLRNSANKDVKLKDLLFINPPLTKDQRRHRKDVHLAKRNVQSIVKSPTHSVCEEPSLIPKVRLGAEGKLILDESSTIINRKSSVKDQDAIIEDNEEIISRTNYESYRRRPTTLSQTKWSSDDTEKFYHALTILGTDFSMMESLLFSGYRSRTELHKKFKREERVNKAKIDIALSKRISLNSEELDELKEMFEFARASRDTA